QPRPPQDAGDLPAIATNQPDVRGTHFILRESSMDEGTKRSNLNRLKIKVFADGADLAGMVRLAQNPTVAGFTTNPTLMRKAGVTDYAAFSRQVLAAIPDRPVSFEVLVDDVDGMIAQARTIASWGRNVNVKVPVMTTKGIFTGKAIRALSSSGIAVNVTAVMT